MEDLVPRMRSGVAWFHSSLKSSKGDSFPDVSSIEIETKVQNGLKTPSFLSQSISACSDLIAQMVRYKQGLPNHRIGRCLQGDLGAAARFSHTEKTRTECSDAGRKEDILYHSRPLCPLKLIVADGFKLTWLSPDTSTTIVLLSISALECHGCEHGGWFNSYLLVLQS